MPRVGILCPVAFIIGSSLLQMWETHETVAGVDGAEQDLQDVVAFLKDPKSYGRLGARVPKGILLVGAPGTGMFSALGRA